jgi:2-amino-4-hydroxy-6-hydroxymethyldihydropteridine diphosphokinase
MTPMVERPLKPGKQSTIAYIGLGANLGERDRTIAAALHSLDADDRTSVLHSTAPIETDPVGYEDQPRFLNAVARLETTHSARELLELLLATERDLGRIRDGGPRYGPRTIDLDLLLFGGETVDEPGLRIPHPRLQERRFVLEPLMELDPALIVPGKGPVAALLAELE